jgi:hypothetical protein
MCRFASIIITKSGKVYGDGSYDNHADLIKENIKDNSELAEKHNKEWSEEENLKSQTFALIEIMPKDNNIFNHKISNWELKIDQTIKPAWWGKTYEKKCFKRLKKIFKTQFLIGGEYEEPNRDVRFVKDAKITILKSKIGEMCGSSQVGKMCGSSQVGKMCDSSQVGEMCDSSHVGKMYDSSQVGEMCGSSQVGKMCGSSQVKEANGNNTINIWSDKSVVAKKIGGEVVVIKRYLKNVKVEIK